MFDTSRRKSVNAGHFKGPYWDSHRNSQASNGHQHPKLLDSNYQPRDSDEGVQAHGDHLSHHYVLEVDGDALSFIGEQAQGLLADHFPSPSDSTQRSITEDMADEATLISPSHQDDLRSSFDTHRHSPEIDIERVEDQSDKKVSNAKRVQKLAMQFTKLSEQREDAMTVRIQGQSLRNRLASLRTRADTISVKLRALLADATTSPQLLKETIEELHSAISATVQFELEYNKHEDLVDEKEYQLTTMEQRFSEKYGPVTFADDLVLDPTLSGSEDEEEEDSFVSTDDEEPTSPTIPVSLSTRDRYVDKVEELRVLRAEQEHLHHDRIHHDVTTGRERLSQEIGSETPPEIGQALVGLRDREKALAEKIKAVEEEESRLENAAIAAGEMQSFKPSSMIKDDENIKLEQSGVDRHPLLFPFHDFDFVKLQIKAPTDEDDLPIGVNDWSLYRLRSNFLDVDIYKANSEKNMWSKLSSSGQSQAELDRPQSKRILSQWHLDSLKNAVPTRGPLTSEMSNVIRPRGMTHGESIKDREAPKLAEILQHRRLPFPYLPGLNERGYPWWHRIHSAPDLDSSYQNELSIPPNNFS